MPVDFAIPRLSRYSRNRLFCLCLPLALAACDSGDPTPQALPAPAVSVIEVGTQEVGEYVEFVARTEAFKSVELRARVEGQITQRLFVEGDVVDEGQLLFEIDRAQYEAAVSEAQANLQSSQAERERTERDHARGRELRPDGYISQADLDTLASNAAKARAAEKAAAAALKNAEINLGYTRITAPFRGDISKANYSVGNLVGPNSEPLASILQDDPIYANFQIPETAYISYLQEFSDEHGGKRIHNVPPEDNITITMTLPNGVEHPHKGTANYAAIEVDASTGTVNIRAQFPNPNGIVRPGLYVDLAIETTDKESLPVIPQYAVQEGQQGKFLLVLDDEDRVKTRNVTVGRRLGPLWVVTEGVDAGDRVIVEGLQKVRTGIAVRAVLKTLDPKTGTLIATNLAADGSTP